MHLSLFIWQNKNRRVHGNGRNDFSFKCIELIEPHLPKNEGEKKGIVVIGAVKGDLHDIGYGLVANTSSDVFITCDENGRMIRQSSTTE